MSKCCGAYIVKEEGEFKCLNCLLECETDSRCHASKEANFPCEVAIWLTGVVAEEQLKKKVNTLCHLCNQIKPILWQRKKICDDCKKFHRDLAKLVFYFNNY